MKTKPFFIIPLVLLMGIVSCKKESNSNDAPKASAEKLNASAQVGIQISTSVQTFMITSISKATSDGYSGGGLPEIPSSKKSTLLKSAQLSYEWTGPDADGWYTRRFDGLYNYYEKLRFGDTTDYVRVISYHGADGSYDNTTTTKYIKYTKNNKVLYKGYSRWEVSTFGDNDISSFEWKIDFTDWNPKTNAGTYDWYWGVSENMGGDEVPYHRYSHLVATETTTQGWLHVRAIYYDDNGTETWDFEYDTPCAPVTMPEIPEM